MMQEDADGSPVRGEGNGTPENRESHGDAVGKFAEAGMKARKCQTCQKFQNMRKMTRWY